VIPYLSSLIRVLEQTVGRNRPFVFLLVLFFGSVVMLGLPQVAFALIGGFLCRRFKSIIARR
jgi:membrane associated rhomboid family serine protease